MMLSGETFQRKSPLLRALKNFNRTVVDWGGGTLVSSTT